jgi:hypothetical protein
MAPPKKTVVSNPTSHWETWKHVYAILAALGAFLSAGFFAGIKYQEVQSNLEATKATQDCNEKIEAERTINYGLRTEMNNKRVDDLSKVVEKLQQQNKSESK